MANSSPIWKDLPGLTACSLCAGETLGESDTEAGGQLQRLQRLAESGVARLTTVECLDLCECGDVVVARPTRASRGAGARPVWFERPAGDEATAELAEAHDSSSRAVRTFIEPSWPPAPSRRASTQAPP